MLSITQIHYATAAFDKTYTETAQLDKSNYKIHCRVRCHTKRLYANLF
jgi:hypothetical protein